MKYTYTLRCRNGYHETVQIKFEARTIIDAETMALNWMKHNFIRSGRLTSENGRMFIVTW